MRVLILGATSAIAEATARIYAAEGAELLLVARQADRLASVAADLKLRGAPRVEVDVRDLSVLDGLEADFGRFLARLGGVDHVLLAYGVLGDRPAEAPDLAAIEAMLRVNFDSAVAWSLVAADALERQGHGSLVVIGSVAGDRGRRANFIYGATKAGLAVLIEGLAHRFGDKHFGSNGPRAVIVKPGPTVTPMTDGSDRKGPLWSSPERVAAVIRRAADWGGPVVYAPWFWRFIMLIIRFLPAPIFNRLDL
jgi:decaprenylphospho-beta-D-erythro-pentofuranosid-2-ulose 2-reductase